MCPKPTWMSPLLAGMALVSIQCNLGTPRELASLPVHELDLTTGGSAGDGTPSGHRPSSGLPADQYGAAGFHPWRYIVVHHSATAIGSAAQIDKAHRARGWDELGYHFVIGNGHGSGDGRVEVGPRWRAQKWGAHTGGTPDNEYNNFGIGICLVGDFTAHLPSPAQLAALRHLTAYLAARYHIPARNIIGHRDAPNATTQCPGDRLHHYVHSTLRGDLPALLAKGG
jgi:hypothetical protein